MSNRSYLVEQPRDPSRPWAPSPFKRLARTHALSVAGDAMFTTAMATLVFFNVTDMGQARSELAKALLFTIVPFSLAAPFIGPLIDRARGGRKWMIFGLSVGRALVCALLVWNRGSPWALYPEFLFALVFAKGYVIAKGALVPTTVHSDAELVQANSKLAAISGVAAVAGGAPSLLVMWIASKLGSDHGPDLALAVAAIVYALAAVQAAQLPSVRVADEPADEAEITELRTAGIRHAAFAISLTRGCVGFLTLMLGLYFKGNGSTVGLVGSVVAGQVGFMVGSAIAPPIRRQLSEERMLMVSLGTITIAGLLTALMGELAGAVLLAFAVGITSNMAKQAFDSIVQRDAPDANRGRAFARFETRFQLVWVAGALLALLPVLRVTSHDDAGNPTSTGFVPIEFGFMLIAVCCGTALVLYYVGLRRAVAVSKRRPSPLSGEPALVEPQPASRSFLRRRATVGAGAAAAGTGPASSGLAAYEADPTLVATAPGDRVVAPSGIDSTMVVAPATVAAAPMSRDRRPAAPRPDHPTPAVDPAFEHTWVQPGGPSAPATAASGPADAPTQPDAGAGLFGAPDAPIPSSLVDAPVGGLFAAAAPAPQAPPAPPVLPSTPPPPLADGPAPVALGTPPWSGTVPPPPAPPATTPVFYDGSSWIDEDDPSVDDLPVLPRAEPRDANTAPGSPDAGTTAAGAREAPGAATAADPSGAPPSAPADHVARPVGPVDTVPFVNPDGSYPEPLWRDATPADPTSSDEPAATDR